MRYTQIQWTMVGAALMFCFAQVHAESADQQLWDAITHGTTSEARDAIRGGALVKSGERDLLAAAASARHADCVTLLLDAGADAHGSKALLSAVAYPEFSLALIERLFKAGASLEPRAPRQVDVGGPSGGVVLQALRSQRSDVALWMLDHGVPVNVPGNDGVSELSALAQRDVVDEGELLPLVKRLLAAGANPALRDKNQKSAADYAAERGYIEVIRLLEPTGTTRDLPALKRLRQDCALATAVRLHGRSRIRWATPQPDQPTSQLAVIDRLLRAGANPNARVKSWLGVRSILDLASIAESSPPMWHADPKLVELLLEHGAKWESCGDRTPVVLFELTGDADTLAVALKHGLSATALTQQQGMDAKLKRVTISMPLLHAAATHGAVQSITLLLQHNASLTTRDDAGNTPLMCAVLSGNNASVTALLQAGAPALDSPDGPTLADLAAKAGLINLVREWDHKGAYGMLTDQYPPQPTSRWSGDWLMGDGPTAATVRFEKNGMGAIWGRAFAWCETDDGVRMRIVLRNPRMPQWAVAQELILAGSPDAELHITSASAASSGGMGPLSLHRAGFSAPKPPAASQGSATAATDEIAAQRAALKSGRSTALYLGGAGLASIPTELFEQPTWSQADIYWSELKTLPKDFARLARLEKLTLANQNSLVVEPGSLTLPRLTRLEIRHSRLTSLPLRFADVPILAELSVYDNHLAELPTGWFDARMLTSVFVAGNRLRRLPDDIGSAPRLNTIIAADNQLTDLPGSLASLPLQRLEIDHNRLRTVPDVVGQCRHLTSLNLGGNALTTIPEAVLMLPDLSDLDLNDNRLDHVPDLSRASHLKRLGLRANRITELPANGDWLPASVTELDLAGNQISRVPDWLRQRAFSRLMLSGTAVPEAEARQLEREAEERWRAKRK
ncbi:MAG: ankyrin repeat domain-containing protein [Lacunisphaera sp.]